LQIKQTQTGHKKKETFNPKKSEEKMAPNGSG